jgi:hypothetical protein
VSNDTDYHIRIKASSVKEATALAKYIQALPDSNRFNVQEVKGRIFKATGWRNENGSNRPFSTDLGWLMHAFPEALVSYVSKDEYGNRCKELNLSGRNGNGIEMTDEDRIREIDEDKLLSIQTWKDLLLNFLMNRQDSEVIRRAIMLTGKLAVGRGEDNNKEALSRLRELLASSNIEVALAASKALAPLMEGDPQALKAALSA